MQGGGGACPKARWEELTQQLGKKTRKMLGYFAIIPNSERVCKEGVKSKKTF